MTFVLVVQGGAGPLVVVDADKKNIVRLEDQVFDPDNPPPDKNPNHDAFTQWAVDVESEADTNYSTIAGGYCAVEVVVTEVSVKAGGEITVFLPRDADDVLRAHEEGHVTIAKEVFQIVAKTIAEDVFKGFPASFRLNVDPCTQEAIEARVEAAVDALSDTYSDDASAQIRSEVAKAQDAYDAATNSGRQGADGSAATAKNQKSAANDAIKDFKTAFKKR
jgi:hypothetical protein